VRIRDAALVAAAVLSDRYISDRFLPDKAIDLVDESRLAPAHGDRLSPVELDEAERRVTQLEIELAAMAKESPATREPLEKELAEAKARRDELAGRWANEKDVLDRVKEITRQIDDLRMEAERAERGGDLARVAEIRYGLLPSSSASSRSAPSRRGADGQGGGRRGRHRRRRRAVDRDPDRPAARGRGREARPHGGTPPRARRRPGRRDRGRLERAPARALGAAGPEPADRLVRLPRPDRRAARPSSRGRSPSSCSTTTDAMVRLDMSEYQERHTSPGSSARPPGYVGYEEGGQLTEAVRRRPYSVLLLDEIEKAHAEVFDVLLQLLDDGRLTDGHGRTVDFRNTVVIMTSNIRTLEDMAERFRPEFLNRIDEIVVFESLTREQLSARS
jgi:ATP-dependent Clp protease ATP-binding subunit ClpB